MLVVRSALSLRIVLLLLVLGAALYAAGLSIYLTLSVGRAAASLGEGAEAVVYQLEDLTHRHHALDRAVTEAHRALDWPAAPDASALRLIRTLAAAGGTRSRAVAFAKMPEVMRVEAARTDERISPPSRTWGGRARPASSCARPTRSTISSTRAWPRPATSLGRTCSTASGRCRRQRHRPRA